MQNSSNIRIRIIWVLAKARETISSGFPGQKIISVTTWTFSFLARLRMFPGNRIKIDRCFLHAITADSHDRAIGENTIHLASWPETHILAEGVETDAQLAFLLQHGCEEAQGYYVYRPMPSEEPEIVLHSSSGKA